MGRVVGRIARPLSALLSILLAFAGGTIDLCSCDPGAHGIFCADQAETASASCHEPPAVPASGCCGHGVAESEPAPGPRPELRDAGCGCPEITLDRSPSEAPANASAAAGLERSSDVLLVADLAADGGDPTLSLAAARVEPWPSWAHRSSLRRHLLLHVLRC